MKQSVFAFFFVLISLISASGFATQKAQTFDYSAFNLLPVLDEGRIKPLESFARVKLKMFSGNDSLENLTASEWLAETIFDPANALNLRVFSVQNKFVQDAMGLNPDQKLYSLRDLQPGLEATAPQVEALLNAETPTLPPDQKALLQLHDNVIAHNNLLRSLSLILPLNIDVPERYTDMPAETTFLHLIGYEQRILKDLKSIIAAKGEDPTRYSAEEQKIAALAFQMQQIRMGGAASDIFKILPIRWDGRKGEWLSPWSLVTGDGGGSPELAEYLALWTKMADAWRGGNPQDQKQTMENTLNYVSLHAADEFSFVRFRVENLIREIEPFNWALGLYALALVILIVSFIQDKSFLRNAAGLLTLSALLLHGCALTARIYILARPPVGTLYESALFVSLICAATGLSMTIKSRQKIPLLAGLICSLGILGLSPILLQKTDSIELLVAVLNTGFWLSTHVICITAGYGIALLTSMLAHGYLALRFWSPASKPTLKALYSSTYKTSISALLFMAVGTVLGGIWADQSWGRFWGWDPKENGALLIVLWLIWIQHGRISGRLKPLAFSAGMAFLSVVVALSWFGVNLLGVGLHSYGFTSGLATGLVIFSIFEMLLIGGLWLAIQYKEKRIIPHET